MTEGPWISAHLFHHGDLSALAVQLVDPLIRRLTASGELDDFFFLRHWDGGDHLRLRVRPAPGVPADRLAEQLRQACQQHLDSHPAPDRVTQEQYAAFASALGRWEHMAEHTEMMYPNNCVRMIPYRPEHGRYGHGASLAAAERHFGQSSRIVLDLLRRGLPAEQVDTAAFSMIMLAWLACVPDPAALGPAIVSYAGKGAATVPRIELWDEFEQRYREQQDRLHELGLRLRALSACPTDRLSAGSLADWVRSVRQLTEALTAAAAAGFTAPARGWEGPGGIGGGAPGILTVLDICAHLACNRLGVTLAEEGYARYLAAQVVYTQGVPA
jgi:thiopeptide-type bacteriocin biosynthesis protein